MSNDVILYINCSINIAGFMMALMCLITSSQFRPMENFVRLNCIFLFGIVTFYAVTNFISYAGELLVNWPMMFSGLFYSSFAASAVMPIVTSLVLHFSGEKVFSRLMKISLLLLVVYYLMLVSTLFSPIFYSVTLEGDYIRGAWYPLLLVPPLLALLVNFIGLWKRRRKLNRRQFAAMLGVLIPPIVCVIIQIFYEGILPIAVGIFVGTFMMFIQVMMDQVDLYLWQKEKNAQQEFEIKVLQMRPHFIYNSLTSIYYLIDSDKEKAKKVVRDFTVYLRKVFSSVVRTEMIPFEEELQHTKAYLSVEEARFGEQLHTVFELPFTDFLIPPLTLQPIVENAVKHGMDPETTPLTVKVRTEKSGDVMQVIVCDDGTGYNPAESTEEGSAIDNIRVRMRKFCNGKVSIRTGKNGRGTCVTLKIPL